MTSEPLGPGSRLRHLPSAADTARPQAGIQRRLWDQCCQVEASFLQQMLSTMRSTAGDVDSLFGDTPGLQMTRQMLDEKLSNVLSQRAAGGIATALYDQMVRHLVAGNPEEGR